ncbi:Uncharacterised protein [Serratia liquefaciens]|nr:Uncharacterised protein [Serratia liquefaciens]
MRYAHFVSDSLEYALSLNPLAKLEQRSDHEVTTQVEKGCNTVEQEM